MPPKQHKGIGLDQFENSPNDRSGKNCLLIVAIDDYVHCPKLNNCVKDAHDLIEILTGRYQFELENIFTLFNKEATRPNIHSKLKELKEHVSQNDNLLIYFSGHGQTEDNLGYWVPVEAHPEREWEFFSTDEIKRRLDAIDSFHTFVIVDACFSGSLFATYKSTMEKTYEHKRSRLGLAASHSRERALDGLPGENSPFAQSLLQKLRVNNQALGIQQLAADLIESVMIATKGKQTPVFKPLDVRGDDAGQFVFHLKEDEAGAWETCVQLGNLDAYRSFVSNYPNSSHILMARQQIDLLQDEAAWILARQQNSLLAFIHYRRDYPQGKYRDLALEIIQTLEEEQVWREARKRQSIFGYEEYREKYPRGKFLSEAEQAIDLLLTQPARPKEPVTVIESRKEPKSETAHQPPVTATKKNTGKSIQAAGFLFFGVWIGASIVQYLLLSSDTDNFFYGKIIFLLLGGLATGIALKWVLQKLTWLSTGIIATVIFLGNYFSFTAYFGLDFFVIGLCTGPAIGLVLKTKYPALLTKHILWITGGWALGLLFNFAVNSKNDMMGITYHVLSLITILIWGLTLYLSVRHLVRNA